MAAEESATGHMLSLLRPFRCLGAECEDTCCQSWDMQVNPATQSRYRNHAPELLTTIEETSGGTIMRRDAATGHCLQLQGGLCGIQAKYGESMLGDACYLYPRSVRALQAAPIMTATLSCPEIARLAFTTETPFLYEPADFPRVPETLREYAPEGMTAETCLSIATAFQSHARAGGASAGEAMMDLCSVARSLDNLPQASWPEAVSFYLRTAAQRRPVPEKKHSDLVALLHALVVLLVSMKHRPSARLQRVLDAMARTLNATIDWEKASVQADIPPDARYVALESLWQQHPALDATARRMSHVVLALHLFPFGGQATSISDKALLIAFRFALYRLALAAVSLTDGVTPGTAVAAIQPLARFLDHLQDTHVTLMLCQEAGWHREARLYGLLTAGGFFLDTQGVE